MPEAGTHWVLASDQGDVDKAGRPRSTRTRARRPVAEAVAYETLPIDKRFHKWLKDSASDVYEMLKKVKAALEKVS